MPADPGPEETVPPVRIDRLVLDLPAGSADQGRQVALLVAEGLAASGMLPRAGAMPKLNVAVTADARTEPAALARRIVAATLRELARTP